MIIQKIELNNIRIHSHIEIEPLKDGITTITGENGSGKSTIFDTMSWVLFGTRINGLKNASLIKEGVDPKEELVSGKVYFSQAGKEYLAERIILNNSGKSDYNVYELINDEYELVVGPGVTHSEEFIRKILGYDEKGFLTSVFIQQKQVDDIINASPRDRAKVIENLVGLSSITEAINIAKEESKALQKAADVIQVSDLEEEKQKVEEVQKDLKEQKEVLIDTQAELKKTIEENNKYQELYNTEQVKQEQNQALHEKINNLKIEKKYANEYLNNQIELINSTKIDGVDISQNIIDKFEEQKDNLEKQIIRLNNQLEGAQAEKTIAEDIISKAKDSKNLEKILEEKIKHLEEVDKFANDSYTDIIKLRTNLINKEELINKISDNETTCPICNSEIKNTDDLIKENKKHISKMKEELEELLEEHNKYNSSKVELSKEITELQGEIEISRKAKEYKEKLKEINKIITDNTKEIRELRVQLKSVSASLKNGYSQLEKVKTLDNAKQNVRTSTEKIAKIDEEINKINKELKDTLSMSPSEFISLRKTTREVNEKYNKLNLTFTQLKERYKYTVDRAKLIVENYKKCEEADKKYKSLMQSLTSVNASRITLENFKKERAEQSVPTLSSIASEILSRFTNNKFTQLKILPNFDIIIVTDANTERPIAQLSGGELSAAAIALRLAISLFLHESTDTLLIMDEVLASMSEERSALMLEVMSNLTEGQTIIISHSPTVNSISDKVIDLSDLSQI